jgi:hypothetical protein
MTVRRPSIEQALLLAGLLLAVVLRLFQLGVTPLSDIESSAALTAWQVAQGNLAAGTLGAQPAYTLLTSLLFELYQSTNFLARLVPAVAGSLLLLAPYLLRHQIGRVAAFVLIIGLAIDPGMVTVSRQAGSLMMALAFSVLAISFWHSRSAVGAGIFTGLALLSGPTLIAGLIPLGLAAGITCLIFRRSDPEASLQDEETPEPASVQHPIPQHFWRNTLAITAVTILLVVTQFFRVPQGLSSWLEMIPAYLQGWATSTGVPPLRLPATLIFFQPLALLFAVIGVLFGLTQRNLRLVLFFTLWLMIALGLGMLYPSRQVADLIWVLIPLWGLAAFELTRFLPKSDTPSASYLLAMLVFILMGLFWFSLASMTRMPIELTAPTSRWLILLGILALLALSTALVSMSWSWQAGRNGLAWGLMAGLTVYLTSTMWGAAQLRFNMPQELWGYPPATGQAELLQVTLDELSLWNHGTTNSLDIQSTVDLPSLRWFLRNNPQVRYVSQISVGEQPSILITAKDSPGPALETAYRGQDFVWSINPGWSGALPPDLLSWFTYRRAPLELDSIIVWARNDLFPGQPAEAQPASTTPP